MGRVAQTDLPSFSWSREVYPQHHKPEKATEEG